MYSLLFRYYRIKAGQKWNKLMKQENQLDTNPDLAAS
jgi:hypothetical protein